MSLLGKMTSTIVFLFWLVEHENGLYAGYREWPGHALNPWHCYSECVTSGLHAFHSAGLSESNTDSLACAHWGVCRGGLPVKSLVLPWTRVQSFYSMPWCVHVYFNIKTPTNLWVQLDALYSIVSGTILPPLRVWLAYLERIRHISL